MGLSKVKLAELVTKSFDHKKISRKDTRKMLEALWEKYWEGGLESFKESTVLSSYICFPHSKKERDTYVKAALARLKSQYQEVDSEV